MHNKLFLHAEMQQFVEIDAHERQKSALHTVRGMAADSLTTQWSKASLLMLSAWLSWYIPGLASER